ncbi:luciferase domain-containing protein [Sphingobacterium sp. MYb382]|uniref:luciferase domain-containing protein n=1 Tax=Sphingobacterium sp. MYb382 TaxID=2745278 RepID=UPI0030A1798B
MFSFVVNRLGFLKHIPFLAIFYDSLLKLWILVANPQMLNWIDAIEDEVLQFPGTDIQLHKYGGTQFNYCDKEFAHLHSNGLLDILFSQKLKKELLREGRIQDHHVFENSGWISFYVKNECDVAYAIELLRRAYDLKVAR